MRRGKCAVVRSLHNAYHQHASQVVLSAPPTFSHLDGPSATVSLSTQLPLARFALLSIVALFGLYLIHLLLVRPVDASFGSAMRLDWFVATLIAGLGVRKLNTDEEVAELEREVLSLGSSIADRDEEMLDLQIAMASLRAQHQEDCHDVPFRGRPRRRPRR